MVNYINCKKEQPSKNGVYPVQLNDGTEYWASWQTGKPKKHSGRGRRKKQTSRSKKRGWQRLRPRHLKIVGWSY